MSRSSRSRFSPPTCRRRCSQAEIEAAIADAIAAAGAKSAQDMGKVMAALKPKLSGRADMAKVSGLVKTKLSS